MGRMAYISPFHLLSLPSETDNCPILNMTPSITPFGIVIDILIDATQNIQHKDLLDASLKT